MTTDTCPDCGKMTERTPIIVNGVERFKDFRERCEECEKIALERFRIEEQKRIQQRLENEWLDLAPAIYRESDTTRFPAKIREAIESYDPNSGKGLGIVGVAGSCKTRAAYALLKRLHMKKARVCAMASTTFARASMEQFDTSSVPDGSSIGAPRRVCDGAKRTLSNARNADFLLLDDIGKGKFTERVETDLWDLLEHRTSNNMPIIWTSNAEGKQLAGMLSEDRSQPIIRRLVEFSTIVKP